MATYAVTGMTCQNCRAHAEEALGKLAPGAVVTLVPPRAILPDGVDLSAANAALARAGGYKLAERLDGVPAAAPQLPASGGGSSPILLVAAGIVIAALAAWMLGVF